jgi:PAS domain S-box-containing protein
LRATEPSNSAGEGPAAPPGAELAINEILDGLAEGFFALDSDWRFVAFNRAAEEVFDLRREDVIGRDIWDVSPTTVGSEFERRYRLVMTTREKQVFETWSTRRPDRYHEIRAFPLGAGIGVAFCDVTDRQVMIDTLRRRERELERVQRIGGVGGMHVDLRDNFMARRSPEYAGIYGLPPQAEFQSHAAWVQRLHPDDRQGAVERLFAAVAGGGDEYKSEYRVIRPSDGAARWIRAIAEIERDANGETIALTTLLADGVWRAYVDPNQLESALLNLALNARDAMPRGGRLIIETANRRLEARDVAVFAERVEPGEYVMIAVMDTGAGMDAETLARACDPFFTTKDVGKGVGLGLSQVYGFCRQSGGELKIESEPGRGATVRMFLPRQTAPASGLAERNRAEFDRPGGRESILLVEDDDGVRAYATEALRDLGYRVAEASSGKAALTVLDGAPNLDLLLTDVVMPGEYNGRELAEEALRRRPGLRVLYMTGYSRDAIMRHGRLDPGVHLLGKPFSMEELAAKVRSRLDEAN